MKILKKYEDTILNIIRIKINIFFIIIFMGGVLYVAERLGEAIKISEIFFWVSMLFIFMFNCFRPLSEILNLIEEWNIKRLDAQDTKGVTKK